MFVLLGEAIRPVVSFAYITGWRIAGEVLPHQPQRSLEVGRTLIIGDDGQPHDDSQMTSDVKCDGKDYPAVGTTVPPGLTLAIEKVGLRSFDLMEKQNGKPQGREGTVTSLPRRPLVSG